MKSQSHKQIFALGIGAHPDDIEVGAGGLIASWTTAQKSVGIIDLTQGELSTNGIKNQRTKESLHSSQILNAAFRQNMQLPDGEISPTLKNIKLLVAVIRKHQPKYILAPYWLDRHPDHVATSLLIQQAVFKAALPKYKSSIVTPHRVQSIFYYMLHGEFEPSFVVDISHNFAIKLQSIRAYNTQFGATNNSIATPINSGAFVEYITARSKFYGYAINALYGEPYIVQHTKIGITDPSDLLFKQP